ncbi:nucleic acid-binding protein [Meira miltonrushii]|uniref:Nucleic acid-binding protein n=1 Tax=Meira miltonrushii TaxID=1280837 RepID=A0A316VAA0_9BASI|nr:nucleic acid-binding protein [Meira miltonrushii]PWN34400.1 nucleic acid-binding protein [Meira miltonrushii]
MDVRRNALRISGTRTARAEAGNDPFTSQKRVQVRPTAFLSRLFRSSRLSIRHRVGLTAISFLSALYSFRNSHPLDRKFFSRKSPSQVLDRVLANKTFIAGNAISLADLGLFSSLYDQVSKLPAAEQYAHLNVTRYVSHISHVASQLPHDNASQYAAFDPTFEGQPTIERKDVAAEKQKAKEQKQAAQTAKEHSANAEKEGKAEKGGLAAVAAAPGAKKEKKPKGEAAGGGKKKNEPAAPTIPIPSQVDLRVGKIVKVERHPDADSLYLEQVDFGEPEGPRTILSGLVNYVPIEKMQDRWVVGVCNLKPASMRGIKSYGMLLCASQKDAKDAGVEPVHPPEGSAVGDCVYVEGYEGLEPETQLNPKKKIFETIQPNYTTTEGFECAWVGAGPQDQESGEKTNRLIRTAKGVITAPGFAGAQLS